MLSIPSLAARRFAPLALLISAMGIAPAHAITVSLSPPSVAVEAGSGFDIRVAADIPEGIVGWGLDLTFDQSVLSLLGTTLGSVWFPAASLDGDNLLGLAFPDPVTGTGVLLATLHYSARQTGSTSIDLSFSPDDFTEGFPLALGGFADVFFSSARITVTEGGGNPVNEPGNLWLAAFSTLFAALATNRRRAWHARAAQ